MTQLTIAIPTYNRNDKLSVNIRKIILQSSGIKILILDNCSDVAVEETLRPVLNEFPSADIKIYRNKTNIGICANFLRCFEYCETEWMWLLSDDDPAYKSAVQQVLTDIEVNSDYTFFNYGSSMVEEGVSFASVFRTSSFTTTGINEFVERFDLFTNLIFVSSGVYNVRKLLPNLRVGYIYSYSLVPHIITVMSSLGAEGKVLFSKVKLVDFAPPAAADTWSRLTFCQAVTVMLEAPFDLDDRHFTILFEKITEWYMTDLEIFLSVTRDYSRSGKKAQYLFVQLMARTFFKKRSLKQKLLVARLLLRILFFPGRYLNVQSESKSPIARI